MLKPEELHLTQEWDKTFAKSDRVDHKKVTFINRFGLTLAADQYTPKDAQGRLPAVAVCGPFGAVKEQSASTPRRWQSVASSPSPLTPPSPARAAGVPAIPPPRTSTPRTSRQRWISSLFRTA